MSERIGRELRRPRLVLLRNYVRTVQVAYGVRRYQMLCVRKPERKELSGTIASVESSIIRLP